MGTRGQKPIPIRLKLLQGNPGKNPIREGPEPAVVEAVPLPPEYLTAEAREEWGRVSVELYRMGMLTVVDIASLSAYCQSYGRWIAAERALARMAERDPATGGLVVRMGTGRGAQNPLVHTANKAMKDMVNYAAEFGLTPAARVRIAQGPPINRPRSKFDGLLGGY
jgi:P27 family predicted phage terminase small subunit